MLKKSNYSKTYCSLKYGSKIDICTYGNYFWQKMSQNNACHKAACMTGFVLKCNSKNSPQNVYRWHSKFYHLHTMVNG